MGDHFGHPQGVQVYAFNFSVTPSSEQLSVGPQGGNSRPAGGPRGGVSHPGAGLRFLKLLVGSSYYHPSQHPGEELAGSGLPNGIRSFRGPRSKERRVRPFPN